MEKLNESQQKAYLNMIEGKNILLTGSGGVGKSYLIKYFLMNMKEKAKIAVTSTTGVSAINISGTTLHSFTGIGLGDEDLKTLYYKITHNVKYLNRWKFTNILIIDECSMLKPDLFDKLEKLGRLIRESESPFGGMQIILSGDFLQLPCVNSDSFLFESESWSKVIHKVHYLTDIVRQKDQDFCEILEKIRVGNIDDKVKEILSSRIGAKLINEFKIEPTLLFCKNIDVDRINNQNLDKLIEKYGDVYEYYPEWNFIEKKSAIDLQKYKKALNLSEVLKLTKNCQIMLTYNLDLENDLVNGSRGVVEDFDEDNFPIVQFANGVKRTINFIDIEIKENKTLLFTISFIPLRLAYATSIHKSQGSTLDYVKVDLNNLFEYGQGYVALSRVRSLEGLSLIGIDWNNLLPHPKALNFYKNIDC